GQTWEDIIKNIIDTAPTVDKLMNVLWAIYFHTTLRGQTKQTATLAKTVIDPQNPQNFNPTIIQYLQNRGWYTRNVRSMLNSIRDIYQQLPP
ncbi:MAG: hypothetical protein C4278_01255, partial [Patescibacteria group bacterium]